MSFERRKEGDDGHEKSEKRVKGGCFAFDSAREISRGGDAYKMHLSHIVKMVVMSPEMMSAEM